MQRIQLGHGGWRIKRDRLASACVGALIAVALLAGGCSSKQNTAGSTTTTGTPMGEENLSNNKSSLEQYQQGTLGGGRGGPLSDIHFDYDAYTIRSQDGEVLRFNARWLNQHPATRVQVEGHCDQRGSEDYNMALGAKRAQAAKDYLVTLGVANSRISTISYGKELPLCTEMTEDCWAQNRRDHFAVSQATQ